ncbi:LOW QUALITY PROTEIN: uncharacterized protein [Amphiura filiformis]|uniref:LOW QUALITY PROTEIN: uncharacterized protein n=1 Tax=Amphiura filiformis TaxID=82378 RepID=UPI003B20C201
MAAPTKEHVLQQKRRRENVELSFAQRLAGNEKKTRDRAIKKLNQWIEARSKKSGAFSEEDLMKLWKGLFYCMWMSDKPLVQEELAGKIADLTTSFATPDAALGFFDTCLMTIKREWAGIDFFRIDKFMMMVRKCLAQALVILKQNDWNESLVDMFLQILIKTPLNPDAWACPDGLRIHISDIFREELGKIGADQLSKEQVNKFVDPFCVLVTTTKSKSLSQIMLQEFFGEIVSQSDVGMEEGSDSEDEGIQSGGDGEQEAVSLKDEKKKQKRKGKVEDEEEEEGEEEEEEVKEGEELIDKWEEHLAEIPQLQYDFSAISDRLLELAGSKDTLHHVRRNVYIMVQKLRDLAVGFYPLPDLEQLQEEVQKVEKKTERELDPELREKVNLQNKLKKKKRKRRKKTSESEGDSAGDKKDDDDDDEEEEEEVEEEEMMSKQKRRKKEKKAQQKDVGPAGEDGEETTEKPRKKRKRRRKQKLQDQQVIGEGQEDDDPSPAKMAKVNDDDASEEQVKGQKSKDKGLKSKADVTAEDASGTEKLEIASPPRSSKKQKKKGDQSENTLQDTSRTGDVELESPMRSATKKQKASPATQSKNAPKTPRKDIVQQEESGSSVSSPKSVSTPKSSKKANRKSSIEGSLPSLSEETSGQDKIKVQGESAKKKRRKSSKLQEAEDSTPDTSSRDAAVEHGAEQKTATPGEKAQPRSAKKRGRKSQVAGDINPEVPSSEGAEKETSTPRSAKKKGRKSKAASEMEDGTEIQKGTTDKKGSPVEKEVTPISKRTRRKSAIIQAKLKEVGDDGDVPSTPVVTRRSKRLSESEDGDKGDELTTVKPATTPASAKKRVKIALSQNEVRAAKDYRKRVQNSPGIPFDSAKKPVQPALKFTPPTTRARSKVVSAKKKR